MKYFNSPYFEKAKQYYIKLSLREKSMLIVIALFFVLYITYSYIYTPVQEAFANQQIELDQASKNMDILAVMLEKHSKLKARRDEIEAQYEEIEAKESGITLLERLIGSKFSLPPGSFQIKDGTPQEFGGSYEKTSYVVKFKTSDLDKLVSFLKELVHGSNPMILKRLDLKKQGDRIIDVDMDVSSIRKIK